MGWGCGRAGADLLTTPPTLEAGGADAPPVCAGFAAKFNGSAQLRVPRMIQDDFTIEAWIKTASSPSGRWFWDGNGLIYADSCCDPDPADDFGTSVLNGKFAFGTGNPDTVIESSTDVTTDRWVHVAATRMMMNGENRVYVNGALESSVTTTEQNSLTTQPTLTLGNTLGGHYYVGLMDEVRLWNVVRTASEIAVDMHGSSSGNEQGLVAYWRFDDPGGSVALDSSPSHADATIIGPLQWAPLNAPICPAPP